MSKTDNISSQKPSSSVLLGAAFLMATSAIGPGFLTQSSTFTAQYGAPLIMIILLATLMDMYLHQGCGHKILPIDSYLA